MQPGTAYVAIRRVGWRTINERLYSCHSIGLPGALRPSLSFYQTHAPLPATIIGSSPEQPETASAQRIQFSFNCLPLRVTLSPLSSTARRSELLRRWIIFNLQSELVCIACKVKFRFCETIEPNRSSRRESVVWPFVPAGDREPNPSEIYKLW